MAVAAVGFGSASGATDLAVGVSDEHKADY